MRQESGTVRSLLIECDISDALTVYRMLIDAVIRHRAAEEATVAKAAGTFRSVPAAPLDFISFIISETLLNTVTTALQIAAVQKIPRQLVA